VRPNDKGQEFAARLLEWFATHERRLPWRWGRPPYEIAVAVVMLQHTAVASAAPVYERFLARYPTVEALAAADPARVRALVAPLGLPARAERLVRLARAVVQEHGGQFPDDEAALRALPGIGQYGAATIACLGFGRRAAMVDVNVVRILARVFSAPAGADVRSLAAQRALLLEVMPQGREGAFNTALLDLGALVCTARRPKCPICPERPICDYADGAQLSAGVSAGAWRGGRRSGSDARLRRQAGDEKGGG
jgi:A/G-specific adenine glycosylase